MPLSTLALLDGDEPAREAVADWREDLRILYVACTRARDLLVLSAGLTEWFPENAPADRPSLDKT